MKLNTIYAARLRQVREDREVPIERICTALGITPDTYRKYESGCVMPKIQNVIKLADFFSVSIDYLIGHDTRDCADTTEEAVCNYIGFSPEAVRAWHKTRETRIYWRVTR